MFFYKKHVLFLSPMKCYVAKYDVDVINGNGHFVALSLSHLSKNL